VPTAADLGIFRLRAKVNHLALVTVSGLDVNFPAGTYWLGVQNIFETNTEFSTYATTGDDSSVYLGPDPAGQYAPEYTNTNRFKQVAFSEPSTWAMTLLGFAGLVWLARRGIERSRLTRFESA
jgi:hypothetical protein